MSTSPTTIRLDDDIKKVLPGMLKKAGFSISSYFNAAARQFIIQGKVPFEILAPKEEMSEETEKALVEARAKELGIIPDNSPKFNSADDALKYLNDEN